MSCTRLWVYCGFSERQFPSLCFNARSSANLWYGSDFHKNSFSFNSQLASPWKWDWRQLRNGLLNGTAAWGHVTYYVDTFGMVSNTISTTAASLYSFHASAFFAICSASAVALASIANASASPFTCSQHKAKVSCHYSDQQCRVINTVSLLINWHNTEVKKWTTSNNVEFLINQLHLLIFPSTIKYLL